MLELLQPDFVAPENSAIPVALLTAWVKAEQKSRGNRVIRGRLKVNSGLETANLH